MKPSPPSLLSGLAALAFSKSERPIEALRSDPAARAKEGLHLVGDMREFQVSWSQDGWRWTEVGQDRGATGFESSEDAYRSALRRLG